MDQPPVRALLHIEAMGFRPLGIANLAVFVGRRSFGPARPGCEVKRSCMYGKIDGGWKLWGLRVGE
jgi:hypothetical protein